MYSTYRYIPIELDYCVPVIFQQDCLLFLLSSSSSFLYVDRTAQVFVVHKVEKRGKEEEKTCIGNDKRQGEEEEEGKKKKMNGCIADVLRSIR